MWHYWITGILAGDAGWRAIESAGSGIASRDAGLKASICTRLTGESSCMNATVTVALEQARAQNPSTEGENNLVACA